MEVLSFLMPAFTMCLILVGIHCYLGLHVLQRGVIFIDLSLAQVASLGSTIALLFHFEHHTLGSYLISLGFTLVTALYFAFGKKFEKLISQEVLIALVYAMSSSLVILVVSSMAHGSEHIKEIMVGKILWVSWDDVFKTAIIYSIVGLVHFKYRNQLIRASFEEQRDPNITWDFIFYALFGVVITSSVGVAGILLVFSFLVVPALLSKQMVSGIKMQLIVGWIIGIALCFIGLGLSYALDYPAGAVLVVSFTIVPLVIMPFLKTKPA